MRRGVVIPAVVAAAFAGIIVSCTVFDGLTASVDAGTGSDATTAVDAGGEVGPDLSHNTQPGYLSLADGVAFCSNAFACPLLATSVEFSIDVPVDANHFSSCVDWVSGPLPKNRVGRDTTAQFLQCAAKAKSCTEAAGCMWYELLDQGDNRCTTFDAGPEAGTNGVCAEDGGALYFCRGSSPSIEHCTNGYFPAGFGCIKGQDGLSYCAGPTCTGDQCSGPTLQFCGGTNKILNGWNCNAGGFTCGFDSTEGFNDCLTNGTAKRCSALSISCGGDAGDFVTICDSVYVSQFDCNVYGGKCDKTGFPRCTRPGATCTPADPDVDVCNGSIIDMCVGGAKVTFDCASLGKTCAPASGGRSAACR